MTATHAALSEMTTANVTPTPGDVAATNPSARLPDFEAQWRNARVPVWRWCLRTAGNEADAQDLFQQVALRAWRGYGSFRGDASFLTWTLAIARRAASYHLGQRATRQKQQTSLETLQENAPGALPHEEAPALPTSGDAWLPRVVREARAADELTDQEAAVMLVRLQMPEAGWSEVGQALGLGETACAVLHCRAVPKLRVFLFAQRPDLIGGREAIALAFALAQQAQEERLTEEEAQTFRRVVLESDLSYRKSGWRTALRSACDKVIKRMSVV